MYGVLASARKQCAMRARSSPVTDLSLDEVMLRAVVQKMVKPGKM
jgi:hypothetical protein